MRASVILAALGLTIGLAANAIASDGQKNERRADGDRTETSRSHDEGAEHASRGDTRREDRAGRTEGQRSSSRDGDDNRAKRRSDGKS